MTYISPALRTLVIQRAGNCCEYCLLPQDGFRSTFHLDHVVSQKHGGLTSEDNLCLCCVNCNLSKGTDISAYDAVTEAYHGLFNPRLDPWDEHFRLNGVRIEPLTPQGRVTEAVLQLNHPERLTQRRIFADKGTFPCKKPE